MVLFINPRAAGGTAQKKWKAIEAEFIRRYRPSRIHVPQSTSDLRAILRDSFRQGETEFVAAGGDGTVNALLNSVFAEINANDVSRIRIGALGLGSSNDFHKPFLKEQFISSVPCKVNFQDSCLRDVGCISFDNDGEIVRRYFLANASCGVTAEANRFFNDPNHALSLLKRASTSAAILYAAIMTILRYRNFECNLRPETNEVQSTLLTNLAVMKNPHVSGSFHYDTPVAPNDCVFVMNLSENMSKIELLHLLYSLSQGTFTNLRHTRSWSGSSMSVTSDIPFAIEYDGEIVCAQSAEFTLLHNSIQVCP
jgi:diacylglycerol kinase (ATP)